MLETAWEGAGAIRLAWDSDQRRNVVKTVLNPVFFLLGESPAPELYVPTFRNTLSHLGRRCKPAHEHGIVFRNVGTYNSDAEESPKRKNTTFRTRALNLPVP